MKQVILFLKLLVIIEKYDSFKPLTEEEIKNIKLMIEIEKFDKDSQFPIERVKETKTLFSKREIR